MNYEIEEFACDEITHEPTEATEEALQLIEQLELVGQKTLMAGEDSESNARMPYPKMTDEQQFILEVLCPGKSNMKSYSRTPIPLRILQIAAHANSLHFFEEIQVWDAQSSAEKDPVLVGKKGYRDYWLLARWGEHLDNWMIMMKKAKEKAAAEMISKYSVLKSDVEARITRIKQNCATQEDLTKTNFYV